MIRLLKTLVGLYAMAMFLIVVFAVFSPLLIVAPKLSQRRALGRLGVKLWLTLSFMPLRVRSLENLPPGPCIAVCNHAS